MMKQILMATVILATGASAVQAAEPMTAEQFDQYTRGKTLYYAEGGIAYGIEEYLSNRRVRWSYLDGECQDGRWYPAGELICFVYENIEDPQCWRFFEHAGGLSATFGENPDATQLYETLSSEEPLMCLGPKIGV